MAPEGGREEGEGVPRCHEEGHHDPRKAPGRPYPTVALLGFSGERYAMFGMPLA